MPILNVSPHRVNVVSATADLDLTVGIVGLVTLEAGQATHLGLEITTGELHAGVAL